MRHEYIRTFYEANRQGLYAYALTLTGDTAAAEDAVQTAIYKLLKRSFLPSELRPYAYRCVRNAAIDERRRFAGRMSTVPPPEDADTRTPGRPTFVDLVALLQRLTPAERDVVALKCIKELTFDEIARIDGSSLNTVASRYRRALEKLRAIMEEEPR